MDGKSCSSGSAKRIPMLTLICGMAACSLAKLHQQILCNNWPPAPYPPLAEWDSAFRRRIWTAHTGITCGGKSLTVVQ